MKKSPDFPDNEFFKAAVHIEKEWYISEADGYKTFRWIKCYDWEFHSALIEIGLIPGEKLNVEWHTNTENTLPSRQRQIDNETLRGWH